MLDQHSATVEQLLRGLSLLEVRELCLEALRECHACRIRAGSERERFGISELGRYLLPILAKRRNVSAPVDNTGILDQFREVARRPYLRDVAEFVVWFARAGLGFTVTFPSDIYLTRAGLRLLDQPADHPLLPGAITRVCARCPGLPPEIASLLADAHACVDQGLLRPAVTVLGVAYEFAVEEVLAALHGRGILPSAMADDGAAKRIKAAKAAIDQLLPGAKKGALSKDKDDYFATHAAYDFANALRRRRNDASHTAPTYGFEDREEVEELYTSALRHLPNLWRIY